MLKNVLKILYASVPSPTLMYDRDRNRQGIDNDYVIDHLILISSVTVIDYDYLSYQKKKYFSNDYFTLI